MKVLIIGYGNPSRRDDGVGWYVVNRLNCAWGLPHVGLLGEPVGLETANFGPHQVRTLWLQQLDMGLAEDAAAADRVLFVDAHVDEAPTVVARVDGATAFGLTSHVLSPEAVLTLAERCYGSRPEGWRLSVRGEQWDFAAGLSPAVQGRCEDLADLIAARLFDPAGLADA